MKICWDNLEGVYLTRRGMLRKEHPTNPKTLYLKTCEECGEEYLGMKKDSKYCSKKCIRKNKKHTNITKRKMAISKTGTNNPNFGKPMPKETKIKIGKANTGKIKSNVCKRKIGNANRGRIPSEETRQKISIANTGRIKSEEERKKLSEANKGPKSHRWNPNLTDEDRALRKRVSPEYKKWRLNVYKRDGFTCQCCGTKKVKLNAHHILNYSINKELRYKLTNGITLCEKCHIKFHKIFGKQNNNLDQLKLFFNKIGGSKDGENKIQTMELL